jgi:hypothetical protein
MNENATSLQKSNYHLKQAIKRFESAARHRARADTPLIRRYCQVVGDKAHQHYRLAKAHYTDHVRALRYGR